jgi:hypothetical protein
MAIAAHRLGSEGQVEMVGGEVGQRLVKLFVRCSRLLYGGPTNFALGRGKRRRI